MLLLQTNSCCKLREWVWTKTGKGDRLGGDSRLGPSLFLDRTAPLHSLHNLTGPDQRPVSFECRPVLCCSCWSVFAMPCICHALFACLCLDPMPASPLLHCPCVTISTMCARTIHLQCFARTALQAATPQGLHCAARALLFFFCIHPFK